ncbi:MAG: sensor histidine kinase, partial [Candidatus Adiutrix sp.]
LQYFALGMAILLSLILIVVLRWVVRRGELIIIKRNQEREILKERLGQSERLAGLGSMVATVAHEIRNPLGIIHSTADLLVRFLKNNPEKARLAGSILEEADRLSEVVTEFLDFARPQTPRLLPIVVEDLLEELLAFLEISLSRSGVELRTFFVDKPPTVLGDSHMLHRAFLNLLINSIQAMDDGGLLTVSTSLTKNQQNDDCLMVSIEDTGPGLSKEAASHIFSPFYTTKAKGTGLGLVIVRNIIVAHGGEIELVSPINTSAVLDDGPGAGLKVVVLLKIQPQ